MSIVIAELSTLIRRVLMQMIEAFCTDALPGRGRAEILYSPGCGHDSHIGDCPAADGSISIPRIAPRKGRHNAAASRLYWLQHRRFSSVTLMASKYLIGMSLIGVPKYAAWQVIDAPRSPAVDAGKSSMAPPAINADSACWKIGALFHLVALTNDLRGAGAGLDLRRSPACRYESSISQNEIECRRLRLESLRCRCRSSSFVFRRWTRTGRLPALSPLQVL